MGKYADLEQALRDPSLAIISDQITTLSELNRVYLKYRALLSIQKRFSFFGRKHKKAGTYAPALFPANFRMSQPPEQRVRSS